MVFNVLHFDLGCWRFVVIRAFEMVSEIENCSGCVFLTWHLLTTGTSNQITVDSKISAFGITTN